jgi:predicted enzyme related to lactoylglutathione lyase
MMLRIALLVLALFPGAALTQNAPAAQEPEPAMLGIDGNVVFLYYDDIAKAEHFYKDILGLRKTFDAGWVRCYQISGDSYVGIVDRKRGYHKDTRGSAVMLSIVTRNLDDWWRVVQKSGVQVLKPFTGYDPKALQSGFLVQDPGGYTVEFFWWGEGFLNARPRDKR